MQYNILVAGGGSIGRRHLQNLKRLKHKNIYCLRRQFDKNFEEKYNCIIATNFNDLNQFNINIIFICTPTSLHIDSIRYGVKNNCHIFVEKPLTHDLKTYNKIQKLLKGYKKVFFIGFMLRYHPFIKKIKNIIESQKLGPIFSSTFEFGSFLPYWHPYEDYRISYASRKNLGGGVINTITHEIDIMQYFFGLPKYIYCEKMNSKFLSIDVEDQSKAIFSYHNHMSSLHLDYLQKEYSRGIKILFKNGKIQWNWNKMTLDIKDYKTKEERNNKINLVINDLYLEEIKDFFKLIENNTIKHPLNIDHALENTKITLLMHKSSKLRKRISYDLI